MKYPLKLILFGSVILLRMYGKRDYHFSCHNVNIKKRLPNMACRLTAEFTPLNWIFSWLYVLSVSWESLVALTAGIPFASLRDGVAGR
jgi:hypothetical protein